MPPTSTDKQGLGDRKKNTDELYRRILHAVCQGDLVIDRLHQIKEALAPNGFSGSDP